MGRYLSRPFPGLDYYEIFSTVVMGTVFEGTRAELEEFYAAPDHRGGPLDPDTVAQLIAEADAKAGTEES
ncbi:hypothetical protein AB0K18_42935 [Nonomuraea sp. NPDC049421]|uniref:hypothetical protein n=1 Tax=Nonomuraea sp. NPDC049421 TaxID=3155275 RepID=UPI003440C234